MSNEHPEFNTDYAKEYLESKYQSVTKADFDLIVLNTAAILKKCKAGPLAEYYNDVVDMIKIVESAAQDTRVLSEASLRYIAFALKYIYDDIDVIPDFVPEIGLEDDAMILKTCLEIVEKDLKAFRDC